MARHPRSNPSSILHLAATLLLVACPEQQAATFDEGADTDADSPVVIEIVDVGLGEEHTVLVTEDGAVYSCGLGGNGQLGWPQTVECFWGVRVEGLPEISDVAAGSAFSAFLDRTGKVWGAGYGHDERLGATEARDFDRPVELGIEGLTRLVAHTNFTVALTADGSVLTWGVNDAGGLGSGTGEASATLVETGVKATAIEAGGGYALALTPEGSVMAWGLNHYGTLGSSAIPSADTRATSQSGAARQFGSLEPVAAEIDGVVAIAAGTEHALAVRDDGTVWGWGRNWNLSLAQAEDNTIFPTPVQIPGVSNAVAVAAGSHFSLALNRDGSVYSWGANSQGALGRGYQVEASEPPAKIEGLPPIDRIYAGPTHAFAIARDGGAWSWGQNTWGQLMSEEAEQGQAIPVRVELRAAAE